MEVMAIIRIQGIRPWDGEYELDTDRAFTTLEWRWIKRISSYMPLTVGDGFEGGDPDLFVALAVIAMNRDGKLNRDRVLEVAETLAEAPFDGATITFDVGEADDDIPLDGTSEPDEPSQSDSLESRSISGPSSANGSETSDKIPAPTSVSRSLTSRI
jgi:hypothetical protein